MNTNPGYDAYLAFLKNQTISPAAADAQNKHTFTKLADITALDVSTRSLGLGTTHEAGFATTLANLGQGEIDTVVGFLYYAEHTGREACNCDLTEPDDTDVHIGVGFDPALAARIANGTFVVSGPQQTDVAKRTSVIVEMTPHYRAQFHPSWNAETIAALKGRQVKVVGQLLVDADHNEPAQNCSFPNATKASCWRASAWELHPVTRFFVCELGKTCSASANTNWEEIGPSTPAAVAPLPRPEHIVLVIEENKDFDDVIDPLNTPAAQSRAPYINEKLLPHAALLTQSFGLHHPSQPNYLELFSGSAQGVCNDGCPTAITAPNLAASLIAAHRPTDPIAPFTGYAEKFNPACSSTPTPEWYAQKHCPWRDFTGLPASVSADFTAFPTNFDALPHVAFVIPTLIHDMHNPPNDTHNTAQEVHDGDTWLRDHLEAYAEYAMTHNSLLIITWDEDNSHYGNTCNPPNNDTNPKNRIPTLIIGKSVNPGRYDTPYNHHNLLRTIMDMEGVPPIGGSKTAQPITGIWQ